LKRCRVAIFILVAILTIMVKVDSSEALENNDANGKKFVMLIVNNVNFADLYNMKYTRKLIEDSYISLMNSRSATGYNATSAYATLGWGTRAVASEESSTFAHTNNKNASIYYRRTGNKLIGSEIINININKLISQNHKGSFGATPGLLGEILTTNGYKTAVIGNSDTDEKESRNAGLITMNKKGMINYGDVSNFLTKADNNSPFGIKTNYKLMLQQLKNNYELADFIVIEMGDISRLNKYSVNLSSKIYASQKTQVLVEIDLFINYVVDLISDDSALMIVTPFPSNLDLQSGNRLTPIVLYIHGMEAGILTSDTTRQKGIVANIDIAPTILSFFGLPHEKMIGNPLIKLTKHENIYYIKDLNNRVVNTSRQRFGVLYSFALYQIVASILAFLCIIYKNRFKGIYKTYVSYMLLGNIFAIIGLLLLPLLGKIDLTSTYVLLVSFIFVSSIIFHNLFRKEPIKAIMYSSSILVLVLAVDIVLGQYLITNSILGYDSIIGARYYGIGNEFAGILIGGTIIVATSFLEIRKRESAFNLRIEARTTLIVNLMFALVIILLGFPAFGANVGATITSFSAFLYVIFKLNKVGMSVKAILLIFLLTISGIAIFLCIDYLVLDRKSHLAASFEQILLNGPQVAYQIVQRKIAANLRIVRITVWSRVMILALLILGVLLYRPIGVAKTLLNKYPHMAIGWSGILVSCVIGFMFNDSGIIIAATSVIFLSTSMLYLIINDKEKAN